MLGGPPNSRTHDGHGVDVHSIPVELLVIPEPLLESLVEPSAEVELACVADEAVDAVAAVAVDEAPPLPVAGSSLQPAGPVVPNNASADQTVGAAARQPGGKREMLI